MFAQWGHIVARWRWLVLAVTALLVGVGAAWGPTVFASLSNGGFQDPNSESSRIEARVEQTVGRQATDVVVLYTSPADGPDAMTVDDARFRQAVEASLAAVPREAVVKVSTYWNSGEAPALVSADRRSTFAAVQLSGKDLEARMETFRDVEEQLGQAGGGLEVLLGGQAALNSQINEQVSADLARAESISIPILLILLVLVFGSVVAASLPLAIGALTVLGSFTLLRAMTEITEVSVFSINIVTLLGLGLAIDYALFVVSRFREELAQGKEVPAALSATMATAGRTVAFSGVTVAVALSSLAIFPQVFLKSMAFGGVAAVMVAMLGALTLLPALLAVLGHRVDALRVPLPHLFGRGESQTGGWERFARTVMRRPLVFAGVCIAVLGILALPALRVEFGGIDSRALPAGSPGRVVDETLHEQFPGADAYPLSVLVDGGGEAAAAQVVSGIKALPGVAAVTPQASSPGPTGSTLLRVDYTGASLDEATNELVSAVRAVPAPAGSAVLVGGATAELVDLKASIAERLPLMALVMAGATFLLLFLAFGSLVLPIKAILTNLLSLAAAFGVVVWIFQEGHLSGLLGFTSTGTIETTQPILMLAIVFGLSMDYEVFLLSRVREQWDLTGRATDAVATGLQRTGRIITSAALLLVVVIGAFSTSGITFIKMIGVGMAVAIVIDATIVRAVLVPALMRLLGATAWWAPGPLQQWQRRFGWAESESAPVTPATAGQDDPAEGDKLQPAGLSRP